MDEFLPMKDILKRLEKLLYGYNYECHFQFELIVESTDVTAARDKINSTYNLELYKGHAIAPISYNDFKADINEKLSYRGDKGAGLDLSKSQEEKLQQEISKLWALIDDKFTPNTTTIFIHPDINTWVFWGFCFLIVSREKESIYLFEGLSSD